MNRDQLITYAMRQAISFEESYIDSVRGCDDKSTLDAIETSTSFIKQAKDYLKRRAARRATHATK